MSKDRPPPRSRPSATGRPVPVRQLDYRPSETVERPVRRDLIVEPGAVEPPPGPRRRPERQVAVALKHDLGGPGAPRVVASGWGEVARKILETAFTNNVKVREDPDLARVLAAVEVDSEIPLEAFAAVAEILAYVYRANGRLPPRDQGGTGGSNQP